MWGHKGKSGQSMIETALVLPVLAVLMIGAVDLTHMVYDDAIMREVIAEGGKLAMVENHGHVYTNRELLEWMRTAARAQDRTISRDDIQPGSSPGLNAWEFDGGHFDQVTSDPAIKPGDQDGEVSAVNSDPPVTNGQQTSDTSQQGCTVHVTGPYDTLRLINPGLETIRLDFRFNAGIFGQLRVPPKRYIRTVTQYQFLALPIPNPGCL